MMTQPSPQFTQSIAANISYWQQRTRNLTDDTLPTLDRERQNLYRAAKFGLHMPATWQETAELILQTFVFVERRGYWGEWIPLVEHLLESCPPGNKAMRGRILNQMGLFYRYNRQLDKAFSAHQAELEIGRMLNDKWREAHACINLGAVCREMRRFDEALAHTLEAEQAFKVINAPLIKHAFVTLELGLLSKASGGWADAEQYFGYSISLWREVDDPVYLANCLRLLGQVLVAQDKIDKALGVYHEAIDVLTQTENYLEKTRVFIDLGSLHWQQKNLAEAEQFFLTANSAFLRQSGNIFDQALVLNNLGTVYMAQDKLSEAEFAFQRSIALWKNCDDPIHLANSLGGLAEVKAAQGDGTSAHHLYGEALTFLAAYPQDAWGQKLQVQFAEAVHNLPKYA